MPEPEDPSTSLFKKYLSNNRIFRDREVLRHSYRPQILPHRQPQIDNVASILAPSLRNETPSNILIYGKTGTGKTASVRYVGSELEKASTKMGTACRIVHLNCEVIDTQYRVLAQIAKCIDGVDETASDKTKSHIPMTGWPTDQVYAELKNQLEAGGGVLVIVLDEIDKLVKKSGDDTLYNLTRINSDLRNSKVSIIGISNDLSFKDFLDPRVLSSLSEEEIVFPPYNALQLVDILTQRAAGAFVEGAVADGVNPALCSPCGTGARRCTAGPRSPPDLRGTRRPGRIEAGGRGARKTGPGKDRDGQHDRMHRDAALPEQADTLLHADARKAGPEHLYERGGFARDTRISPPPSSSISSPTGGSQDLISELNMLGVINTRVVSRGRYGRTKEMWFDANTNKIRDVVLTDPRLNGLKDLDINQMEAKWLKTWFR